MSDKLYLLRVKYRLTQEQMAEIGGVSRTTYWKIEKGKSEGKLSFWFAIQKHFPELDITEITKGL